MSTKRNAKPLSARDIFDAIKKDIAILDCVAFAENYLMIDGKPFDLSGNGWKYMAEIYRTVSAQVENKNAKSIVLLKGRQVGATIMASVLSLHMAASGLYCNESGRPPIRVMHAFPDLKRCGVYAKDTLTNIMSSSKDDYIGRRSLKVQKSFDLEDTQTQKNFAGLSKIRIDSIGKSGDRIRGSTQDVIFYDECFWYGAEVATEKSHIKIGQIYKDFTEGKELPLVRSFNVDSKTFELKKITNAWHRGKKDVVKIATTDVQLTCTPDHEILTVEGWKEAKNLVAGDRIVAAKGKDNNARVLCSDQEQMVIGSFLGAGCLPKCRPGMFILKVDQKETPIEYRAWKASMVGAKLAIIKPGLKDTDPPVYGFSSSNLSSKLAFPKLKTSVSQEIVDAMDLRGIAVWFMDMGVIRPKIGATMSVQFLDSTSSNRLVKKLKSLGVDCKVSGYYHNSKSDRLATIVISESGYEKLSELISPYVHSSMRHKLKEQHRDLPSQHVWSNRFENYDAAIVKSNKALKKQQDVYDIEVEDNHNFLIVAKSKKKANPGGLVVSNCQDMYRTAIENTLKVLTASPYGAPTQGVQVFFGTPKHSGSFFWSIWEDSDKRFYQFRCKYCLEYYHLYNLDNEDWNDIWVKDQTVACPHCKKQQDKRESSDLGRWIATRPFDANGKEAKYIGFHFNMMLSPLYKKENVLEYWPQHNKNASERAWKNETKGQFYSASEVPITIEDIYAFALNEQRGLSRAVKAQAGKMYFLGMDWGEKVESPEEADAKRGKSYTCAVVLSADHTGVLTVENAMRLKRNDPDYKLNVIRKIMTDFHIDQAAADRYYANDFIKILQANEGYGKKFLGCTNLGNAKKVYSYDDKYLDVGINKDLCLEEIFALMKAGKIKFPAKDESLEIIGWLIDHVTSMETHIKVRDGLVLKTYKKGIVQNDGLMALMYAYTAYKFTITREFSGAAHGSNVKNENNGAPLPILGHIPKMH